MNNYVYTIGNKIYINLTNRCSNNCDFCIRSGRDGMEGVNLWIEEEPSADDVIEQLPSDMDNYDQEVVLCGFGEPTYNMETLEEVAQYLACIDKKVRINTNGQGVLIAGQEAISILADCCDTINVSLNASNATMYDKLCHSQFGKQAFDAIIDFVKGLIARGANVVLSVVDSIGQEEIANCQKIADRLKVPLRIREKE